MPHIPTPVPKDSPARLLLQLKPMVSLSVPVVMTELGWMTMSLVDTMMVGRLSAEAIGAVSIGTAVFLAATILGMGLSLGLDTLVSQAHGANQWQDCQGWLVHGIHLSLLLSPLMMFILWGSLPYLQFWGFHPEVLALTPPYLKAVTWSIFPLMLYNTFRRYLQGIGRVKGIMVVLVTANLVNVCANWIFIFGKLGFPAMGVEGAGWATCISRLYMALGLWMLIFRYHRRQRTPLLGISFKPDLDRMRQLVNLGLPASLQTTLEVGVFAAVTSLAGKLEPAAVAAHQIALNAAGFVFMVPLGISSAGAVRVGREIGRGEPQRAADSGWMALLLGSGFMLVSGLVFVLLSQEIMRLFTGDPEVIAIGAPLLLIAAAFMFFDGVQVVATGNLRGAADTTTPMVVNLIGHWPVGMVLGYFLCFHFKWGVQGLWVGLSAGLIAIGIVLLAVWTRKSRELSEDRAAALQGNRDATGSVFKPGSGRRSAGCTLQEEEDR